MRGGGCVHWLIEIVGGRVVARANPILKSCFFGSSFDPSEFECQSWDADFYETVLIAADEAVPVGFFIGLNDHALRFGYGANVVTERGLVESLHFQILQPEEREKHIHVQVGDDLSLRDRRMMSKIFGAEIAFFFGGYGGK